MKYSIIILTCNFERLKKAIESIIKTTSFNDAEIIVAMNGCQPEARKYIESLGFRFIWIDRKVGAITSFNLAAKIADGKYLIKLDDDIQILDWGSNNYWIKLLEEPFSDPKMGVVGPVIDPNYNEVIAFCMMTPKKLFLDMGGFDPQFDPWFGDDIDYCYRLQKAGYKIAQNPPSLQIENGKFVMNFPIWHYQEEQESSAARLALERKHKDIIIRKHSDMNLPSALYSD